MNYPDAVHFLYSLGNEVKAAKLGLDRMLVLLSALGDPHCGPAIVHVAGTNGKGSTCAMIEAGLRAAGRRTGLYTSPHLAEPTERIRIAGQPVAPGEFAQAFDAVHEAAEHLLAAGELEAHPTYFETVTAMAFVLFREHAVDTLVLEVGLGGRLDATNVVQPAVAVITPIDYDHEAFLGRGIDSIAAEKAGILKAGAPAVIAPQRPEAEDVVRATAAALGVTPCWAARWEMSDLNLTPAGCTFRARHLKVVCPLAGEHQAMNALTAAITLDVLGIPPDGIASARWPGRLERVRTSPDVILDGAHNPAGALALARYIERFYAGRRIRLIYGAMRDKALEEMAAILFPLASQVIVTAPSQTRAARPETILSLTEHPRLHMAPSLPEALNLVRDAAADEAIFITGSLFLVGEARAVLLQ
ncbi:MAG TPA: folylpolyglutamate synthase/dihydrofolate synthase family protein [Bryobacteraceae bacterium]|nr:folylpolyglutamate synthase/dihydrofolate synthase family protein [Bryobacteraceae bacterium]